MRLVITCLAENPSGKKCALKNSFNTAGAMRARHEPGSDIRITGTSKWL